MKFKDYAITIKSSCPEVKEVETLSGEYAFIGVLHENYSIHIKNNNPDYRIWASLHIDGVPAMLDGWGLLAEPNSSLYWDGFRIDENTVREFVFVDNEKDSDAVSKSINGNIGIIEIKIVQESVKWDILSPPRMMGFMTTGMGDYKESKTNEAKIKFRWGGPSFLKRIQYGSVSDLIENQIIDENFYSESTIQSSRKKERWYKLTIERNFWDSFSTPHNKKIISYAIIDPQLSVTLFKGENNSTEDVYFNNIILSNQESQSILNLVQYIISDPINARNELLDNSTLVSHVGHFNPIYLKVERFEKSELTDSVVVLSWEGDAMFAENGLLKDIIEYMKL